LLKKVPQKHETGLQPEALPRCGRQFGLLPMGI
jgi:hypothetical protein